MPRRFILFAGDARGASSVATRLPMMMMAGQLLQICDMSSSIDDGRNWELFMWVTGR